MFYGSCDWHDLTLERLHGMAKRSSVRMALFVTVLGALAACVLFGCKQDEPANSSDYYSGPMKGKAAGGATKTDGTAAKPGN